MNREYEVFERRPDGSTSWRRIANGLERARVAVWLLADETGNECLATQLGTNEIVAIRTPSPDGKRIFHVAYGGDIGLRPHLLHRLGFDVTSAAGNQCAALFLHMHPHYDLFLIGHAAAVPVRSEMARWIRVRYPNTPIVALNPRDSHRLDQLRYNARHDRHDAWLRLIVATAA
jgi:hypothetical protein